MRAIFQQTLDQTGESQGIFGINVMVAAEMRESAELIVKTMIKVREDYNSLIIETHQVFKRN